jgi:hypothetical protein
MRVTTLRPFGFKQAQTFQSTQNRAQMTKQCQLHGPNISHDTNQEQRKDTILLVNLLTTSQADYTLHTFHGGGKDW